MRCCSRNSLAAAAITVVALAAAPSVSAKSYTPPDGKSFHGVSETGDIADYRSFVDETRTHSAVSQSFYHWGVPLSTGALDRWRQTRTRGVLSLSTAPGGRPEVITPKAIAQGRDDHYMLRLNESIANSSQIVYIRLFPEMNGHWNPYSAFNADGTSRGKSHSTATFRKAWRRFAIIVRGGARKSINAKLRDQKLPRLLRAKSNHDRIYKRLDVPKKLPRPKVALQWVPQTFGSPNIRGNQPKNYYPGSRYVDWVGADAYAKYANSTLWNALNSFYRKYDRHPFVIGEYAPWDADPAGAFTRQMFDWARTHGRTRMLIYFRSVNTTNAFNIGFYPEARDVLRARIASSEFAPVPREYAKKK